MSVRTLSQELLIVCTASIRLHPPKDASNKKLTKKFTPAKLLSNIRGKVLAAAGSGQAAAGSTEAVITTLHGGDPTSRRSASQMLSAHPEERILSVAKEPTRAGITRTA